MSQAERALLREIFRWAHRAGIEHAQRWTLRGPTETRWGVDWWAQEDFISVWRVGKNTAKDYFVVSVTEAVDVLCALGILPQHFSSAYRAACTDMSQTPVVLRDAISAGPRGTNPTGAR